MQAIRKATSVGAWAGAQLIGALLLASLAGCGQEGRAAFEDAAVLAPDDAGPQLSDAGLIDAAPGDAMPSADASPLAIDAATPDADLAADAQPLDAAAPADDAQPVDASAVDANAPDAAAVDAAAADASALDAAAVDAAAADAAAIDADAPDAAAIDASSVDAGIADAGSADATAPDAAPQADAAAPDATQPDASLPDAAPVDAGPAPSPPRLIAPLSATQGTGLPAFRWQTGADADQSEIEICRDRACLQPVTSLRGLSGGTPSAALPHGSYFWRGRGLRRLPDNSERLGDPSPTWTFFSSGRPVASVAELALVPDLDGDGVAELGIVSGNNFDASWLSISGPNGAQTIASSGRWWLGQGGGEAAINGGDGDGDGYPEIVIAEIYDAPELGQDLAVIGWDPISRSYLLKQVLTRVGVLYQMQALGDLDGDGYADLIATAERPCVWVGGLCEPGGVDATIYFGGVSGFGTRTATISFLADPSFRTIYSNVEVRGTGDLDGDGFSDLAVIYPYWNADADPTPPAYVELWAGAATNPATRALGRIDHVSSLTPVGDVNGDGFADLVLKQEQMYYWPPATGQRTVVAGANHFLWGGATTPFARDVEPNLTEVVAGCANQVDFSLNHEIALAVVGATDLDGDGFSDPVFRRQVYSTNGFCTQAMSIGWRRGSAAGLSSLMESITSPNNPSVIPANRPSGCQVPGDLDGDGYGDVLLGFSPWRDNQFVNQPAELERYRGGPAGLSFANSSSGVWMYSLIAGF